MQNLPNTAAFGGLATIDIAILIAYFIGIIALGIILGKKHETAEEYFLAGRGMIWPFIGLSLFASNISSTTLMGLAGSAYSTGISVFNYEWMAAIILVIFALFFMPQLLRSGVYTMPEFLERRFDGRIRLIFSGLTIFLNVVVDTAGGLFAGGLVLTLVFPDVPLWQMIALLALFAGTYTIIGGLAAVIYTDAIQAVLLIIGSVVMSVIAFNQIGSWEAVTAAVEPGKLSLVRPDGDPGVPWLGLLTGVPLLGFYFWCTNQFMMQRVLSAKTTEHGQLGALFAGALKLPVLFIMVLPGTFAIILYPGLDDANLVYPTMIFDLLPAGILGIVLAGFAAALMSQIDSTLNSASTLFTMDFVRRWKPEADTHALMKIGRITTFAIMVLAVLWAPQIEKFPNIFEYLQQILSYTVPPVVAMYLIGTFWSRANASGAFLSLVAGLAAGMALFIAGAVLGYTDLHFLYAAALLFVLSSALLVVGSLATAPPPAEKLVSTMWTRETFDAETAALRALPWYRNIRVLSVVLLAVTGILVGSFW